MDEQRSTTERAALTEPAAEPESREHLAHRVHVDLPRVRPDEMVTTQPVEPARDPRGGRDTETEFMLRNGAFWP